MRGIWGILMVLAVLPAWAGDGKGVYDAKCASCHGKDGKGSAGMAKMFKVELSALDLLDQESLGKKDEDLSALISKGQGKMPSYDGKLKPEEIKEVIAYLRSAAAGRSEPRAEEKGKTAAGKAPDAAPLYKKNCTTCHGADGKGNPAMAKMFKVEPDAMNLVGETTSAKTDEELAKMLTAGKGRMPAFKTKLTEDEIKALIKFLRTLAGAKKEPAK